MEKEGDLELDIMRSRPIEKRGEELDTDVTRVLQGGVNSE